MLFRQSNLGSPYPSQTGIPMLSIKFTISDGQAAPATNLYNERGRTLGIKDTEHMICTKQLIYTSNTHPARRLPPKRFLIFDKTISSSILCLSPSTNPRGGATLLSLS